MIITPADVKNPNVQAYLDFIAQHEGTTKYGYHTQYGGGHFDSLAQHPNPVGAFKGPTGSTTSAAGRYQFERKTSDGLMKQLGLKDFSPDSQDLMAVQNLANIGALDDVKTGNFGAATQKAQGQWESLKKVAAQMAPPVPGAPLAVPAPVSASVAALPTVPATAKNAIATIFDAAKPPAAPTPAGPEPLSDEQHQQLAQALGNDAKEQRGVAQAKFLNEPYTPNFDMPPSLDATINKYMALL